MAIPNQTTLVHHIGEIKHEFKAGMLAEDFPHIANLLVNLYADPIMAVEREYSNNALDAHIAAGNPDPIQITLPTEASPEFVVQDFGVGLSIDDLRDTYSMYGRSTKRGNNNETGQLGLGCKSGLTYADAFIITSVKNGVKVVAQSTKDEHGIGTIRVIDTMATDEPNGVRIAIPVKNRDINTFAYKAEELYQFWDEGTVLVNGKAPEMPEWRKRALYLDDDTLVVPMDTDLDTSYIIMGNVPYPTSDLYIGARYHRFVARVNLGDVDFPPNREQLHDTEHTQACLSELKDYIGERFDSVLSKKLAEAPTRWDATLLKVQWKGSGAKLNATQPMPIWQYSPNGYGRQASANISYGYNHLTDTKVVVVTKFPNRSLASSHRNRLKEYAPDCQRFVVVPTGVDISGLQGRDNVVEWDEIMDETTTVDPSTGKRAKRDETRYEVIGHGSLTAAEIDALPGDKLFIGRRERRGYGDFDKTIVVMATTNQESRLRRLVSGIRGYGAEVMDQRRAAEAALTDADRVLYAAKNLGRPYNNIDPNEVDDPRLAEAIRLYSTPLSDAIQRAIKLDVTIDPPKGHEHISTYLSNAYPLMDSIGYYGYGKVPEDIVFYLNAKYVANIEAKKSAEELVDETAA